MSEVLPTQPKIGPMFNVAGLEGYYKIRHAEPLDRFTCGSSKSSRMHIHSIYINNSMSSKHEQVNSISPAYSRGNNSTTDSQSQTPETLNTNTLSNNDLNKVNDLVATILQANHSEYLYEPEPKPKSSVLDQARIYGALYTMHSNDSMSLLFLAYRHKNAMIQTQNCYEALQWIYKTIRKELVIPIKNHGVELSMMLSNIHCHIQIVCTFFKIQSLSFHYQNFELPISILPSHVLCADVIEECKILQCRIKKDKVLPQRQLLLYHHECFFPSMCRYAIILLKNELHTPTLAKYIDSRNFYYVMEVLFLYYYFKNMAKDKELSIDELIKQVVQLLQRIGKSIHSQKSYFIDAWRYWSGFTDEQSHCPFQKFITELKETAQNERNMHKNEKKNKSDMNNKHNIWINGLLGSNVMYDGLLELINATSSLKYCKTSK